MTGPERRQTPRTTLEKHAYINIEPNNGGIVLNASDGGLCFYSFDPVPRNRKIRFWLSDHNPRVEAEGTLAWTDETQKAGLQFNAVPTEVREKIREWIAHPSTPLPSGERSVAPGPPLIPVPTVAKRRTDAKVVMANSAPPAMVSPIAKTSRPMSGYTRGLATGLLVSVVVTVLFAFNSYRREFGESLIRLGERFAEKPGTQTLTASAGVPVLPMAQPVSAAPLVTTPTAAPVLASPPTSSAPPPSPIAKPQKVVPQADKAAPQASGNSAKTPPAKIE